MPAERRCRGIGGGRPGQNGVVINDRGFCMILFPLLFRRPGEAAGATAESFETTMSKLRPTRKRKK